MVGEPRGSRTVAYGPGGSRIGGQLALEVAGLGGTWPCRLQDWVAHCTGGCRTDRHGVPMARGYLAPKPRGTVQLGSRAVGGDGYGSKCLQDRRVTWGSQAVREGTWGILLVGRYEMEGIRLSGYRSPVARGEEVADGEEVALLCRWRPLYVVSSPLACRGYDTPLSWHNAACAVT